jgi:hypothetical protein
VHRGKALKGICREPSKSWVETQPLKLSERCDVCSWASELCNSGPDFANAAVLIAARYVADYDLSLDVAEVLEGSNGERVSRAAAGYE